MKGPEQSSSDSGHTFSEKNHQPERAVFWGLGLGAVLFVAAKLGWLAQFAFHIPVIGTIANRMARCQPLENQADLIVLFQLSLIIGWVTAVYYVLYWRQRPQALQQANQEYLEKMQRKHPEANKSQLWNKVLIGLAIGIGCYLVSITNPWCESDRIFRLPMFLLSAGAIAFPLGIAGILRALNAVDKLN